MKIHPTAIIDPRAELDASVSVGPYTVIEEGVIVGPDCKISAHAYITGNTTIGARNSIGSFTSVGTPPQDLSYKNEPTKLTIGNDNQIREYTSIHRGTTHGKGVTEIGDNNLLMAYAHIAHDCVIGNHVILANAATLAGHVIIDDKTTIGGLVAIHQFTRIGEYAYIGGMSGVSKDVPPYVIVSGTRNQMRVTGINRIGLKRAGFSSDTIRKLNKAFMIIFKAPDLLLQDALEKTLTDFSDCPEVVKLVQFFRDSTRSVVRRSSDD